MDCYTLLPLVLQRADDATVQYDAIDNANTEGVLRRIVACFELEAAATETLIAGLQDLRNVAAVNSSYLILLTRFLGTGYFAGWTDAQKRLYVSSLTTLYKLSGQALCWKALLQLLGYDRTILYELWKLSVNEGLHYYIDEGSSDVLIPAARVDIYSYAGDVLNADFTTVQRLLFDKFRPIHVLVRNLALSVGLADACALAAQDSITPSADAAISDQVVHPTDACLTACQVSCELVCEAGSCESAFEITVSCAGSCEISCQTACTVAYD